MDLIPETARQMATAEHRHWVVCCFAGFWTWWKLQVQAVKCAKWCRWWKKCQTTSSYGGFLKWWYPTTMGFPTKNDHFGMFWGYPHLRKHPYGKYPIIYRIHPSRWLFEDTVDGLEIPRPTTSWYVIKFVVKKWDFNYRSLNWWSMDLDNCRIPAAIPVIVEMGRAQFWKVTETQ